MIILISICLVLSFIFWVFFMSVLFNLFFFSGLILFNFLDDIYLDLWLIVLKKYSFFLYFSKQTFFCDRESSLISLRFKINKFPFIILFSSKFWSPDFLILQLFFIKYLFKPISNRIFNSSSNFTFEWYEMTYLVWNILLWKFPIFIISLSNKKTFLLLNLEITLYFSVISKFLSKSFIKSKIL